MKTTLILGGSDFMIGSNDRSLIGFRRSPYARLTQRNPPTLFRHPGPGGAIPFLSVACRRHARQRYQPLKFKNSTERHGTVFYCVAKLIEPGQGLHATSQVVDPVVDVVPMSVHGTDFFVFFNDSATTEKWEIDLCNLIRRSPYRLF